MRRTPHAAGSEGNAIMKKSKRYQQLKAAIDPDKAYDLEEALDIIKEMKPARFDETVEIHMKLGIDVRKPEQNVRGTISMPNGIGKSVKLIAFAQGDNAQAARDAGADEVGDEELAKRIQDGWMDFDIVLATPDMMRVVGRLGRILGPQGKMPSPKSGTVADDIGTAVSEFKAGKIEYRADASGNLHAPVGKKSFDKLALKENIEAFVGHIGATKPPAAKGRFILKVVVATTMGPGLRLAME